MRVSCYRYLLYWLNELIFFLKVSALAAGAVGIVLFVFVYVM